MSLAFVDANVLVTALPRSILYLASALETTDYQLVYSLYVEDEAVKNQRPGTVPVITLRVALGELVRPTGRLEGRPFTVAQGFGVLAPAVGQNPSVVLQSFPTLSARTPDEHPFTAA